MHSLVKNKKINHEFLKKNLTKECMNFFFKKNINERI